MDIYSPWAMELMLSSESVSKSNKYVYQILIWLSCDSEKYLIYLHERCDIVTAAATVGLIVKKTKQQ